MKKYSLAVHWRFLVGEDGVFKLKTGGSVWESNPPFRLLAGNSGFEGRAGHQNPMRSRGIDCKGFPAPKATSHHLLSV